MPANQADARPVADAFRESQDVQCRNHQTRQAAGRCRSSRDKPDGVAKHVLDRGLDRACPLPLDNDTQGTLASMGAAAEMNSALQLDILRCAQSRYLHLWG